MNNAHIDDELAVLENYLDTLQAFLLSSFPSPSSSQPVWVEIPPVHDVSPYSEFHVTFLSWGGPSARSCGAAAVGRWATRHPWVVGGMSVAAVGVALWGGYRSHKASHGYAQRRNENQRAPPAVISPPPPRNRVVVVLGGDTPSGLPLITQLELHGFIVITSVSTPSAVQEIEGACNGFVRAIVFDPSKPENVEAFIHSLQTALSRRFPSSEPSAYFHTPVPQPHIHSIISLLTLPPSLSENLTNNNNNINTPPTRTPAAPKFSALPLLTSYLPYHTRTSLTPLLTIQALLPHFRASHAHPQVRDSNAKERGRSSIIVCVPRAGSSGVGDGLELEEAMSAAATSRAVEYLRRDIQTGSLTTPSGGDGDAGDVRVVTIEVSPSPSPSTFPTSSALCTERQGGGGEGEGEGKKDVLVRTILDVLGDARGNVSLANSHAKNTCYPLSLGRRVVVKVQGCMWGLWGCVRGDRICVSRSLPFGIPSLIAPLFESFFRTREALALTLLIHNSRRRRTGRCGECRCAHHHQRQYQEQHHQEREGQGQEQGGDLLPPQPSFATHPNVVAAQETQVIPSPTQDTVNQAQAQAQDGYTPPASRSPASSAPAPPVPASAQPQPQVPTPPPPPPELLWLTASKERKPLFVNPNPSSIGDGIAQEKEKSEHDERDRIREEGTVSPSGSSSNGCSVSDGSRIDASWVSLDE